MKRFILALAFCFVSLPAIASESIPEELVGIWATEDAVLQGPYLFEGAALYLDDDGTGALVGGPPAIGVEILATYNSKTGQIDVDILEPDRKTQSVSFDYDSSSKTIFLGPETKLKRRFNKFSDEIKKGLGLEAEE